MSTHPLNLALRFLLELLTLVAVGAWGARQSDSGWRYLLMIGLPLILAAAWGTFAVPDDPSRSGQAPVVTPGMVRLVLEALFFASGVAAVFALGYPKAGWLFGLVIGVHYLASYDRIQWLWSQ